MIVIAEASLLSRMFDFLSRQPTAEAIVALKTMPSEEARWDYLDAKSSAGELTDEENDELKEYLLAQHLMIIAKANALGKLNQAAS